MLFSNADLKRLIIPLIFEHILAITVGMADTMMIAKAGEAAMSGVSLVNMLNDLMNQVLAALRACNDVRFVMVTISFSMWAFRVGLGYILGVILGLGAIGIWLAMLADWVFRAACFIGRYVRGKWKLKVKSEHERLDIT